MIFDAYHWVDPNNGNWLEVSRHDSVNRIVEGKFHATLQRNAFYSSKEQMLLEDGEFYFRYEVK
jgi:hypothetical protein